MLYSFQKYRKIILFVLLVFVSLFLMTLHLKDSRRIPAVINKTILTAFSPFQKTCHIFYKWNRELVKTYYELINLREENQHLREEVKELRQKINEYMEDGVTNLRLRKLLKFKNRVNYTMLPAEVIGKDATSWFKTVIIDRGEKDDIDKGMPVVTYDGLVGYIIEVAVSTAKVLLIIDENSRVAVLVRRTRDEGILIGDSADYCRMLYLSKTADIKRGDVVITSGLGGLYPKNLVVGMIDKIEKKDYGLFQDVQIIPSTDFSKLEEVFVLQKIDGPKI